MLHQNSHNQLRVNKLGYSKKLQLFLDFPKYPRIWKGSIEKLKSLTNLFCVFWVDIPEI